MDQRRSKLQARIENLLWQQASDFYLEELTLTGPNFDETKPTSPAFFSVVIELGRSGFDDDEEPVKPEFKKQVRQKAGELLKEIVKIIRDIFLATSRRYRNGKLRVYVSFRLEAFDVKIKRQQTITF